MYGKSQETNVQPLPEPSLYACQSDGILVMLLKPPAC